MSGNVRTLNKIYLFLKENRNQKFFRSELRDKLQVEYYSLREILTLLVEFKVIKESEGKYYYDGY